ncbi:MAG: type II toxin-antitoxin system RelE family toxin [Ilumatobacteraceae bacterium]
MTPWTRSRRGLQIWTSRAEDDVARVSGQAKKDLDRLPEPLRLRAQELISRLDAEPALGKKLLGRLQGLRTVRLGRTHRIIYRLGETGPEVVTGAQRRDAYR